MEEMHRSRSGEKWRASMPSLNTPLSSHLHMFTILETLNTFWVFMGASFTEGNGTPLQYFGLENLMDGGAWWAAVHGVAKSHTRLGNFTFTIQFHALEKEMATHSSVLAWRNPETGEPGGLPSMGSHRVGHDCGNLAAAAAWIMNPVYLMLKYTKIQFE